MPHDGRYQNRTAYKGNLLDMSQKYADVGSTGEILARLRAAVETA